MIFPTYNQWREMKLSEAQATNREIEHEVTCEKCEGFGVLDCGCECGECDGEGTFYCTEMSIDSFDPNKNWFFNDVIASTKKFCAWCNRDFLAEVGPFVREFRVGKH